VLGTGLGFADLRAAFFGLIQRIAHPHGPPGRKRPRLRIR
jgi:hypothetical protein